VSLNMLRSRRSRREEPLGVHVPEPIVDRADGTDPEHEALNTVPDADLDAQREVVDAFLAASRDGDFEALVAVLDPDVVLRADLGPLPEGGSREVRGAATVAGQALTYARLGLLVHSALVNGAAGAVSTRDGEPFSVGGFTVRGGKIVEIDILADPARLRQLDLTILDD
jgi:ketosteroid isomerase-like protein